MTTAAWNQEPDERLSLFETADWFRNLATTCHDDTAEEFVLHIEDPSCASFLALRRYRDGRIESLSNYYASLYGPVTTNLEGLVAQAERFAEWLARSRAGTIRLHPLSGESPFVTALAAALRRRGCWVDRYFAFGNWYHPSVGLSWSEYLAARPSRLRNTIVRTRKKLQNDAAFELRITDAGSDETALEKGIADFCAVYGRSWKQAEPHPQFIPGFFRFAHARGWLRLGVGYLDGQPVAAQAWTVKSGIACIFKLAYDAEHAKRGVGTVISAALSEYVLDRDHVREIDFLTGDDAYKAEWMDLRRERVGLIAFQPITLRGLVEGSKHFASRALRQFKARRAAARPAPSAALDASSSVVQTS